jgi:hypothetical protein
MLVGKAHTLLMKRQNLLGYAAPFTQTVADSVTVLQKWSLSDFNKIRDKSVNAIISSLQRYLDAIDGVISASLAVIGNGASGEKQVTGAIELLSKEQMKVWAVNRFRRLNNLAVTLCESGEQHKDDKVQTLLHALFLHSFSSLNLLHMDTKLIPEGAQSALVSAADLAKRRTAIEADNSTQRAEYSKLVNNMVRVVKTGPHWRYELMCFAFLVTLMRPEVSCGSDHLMLLLKGLCSEVQPLRKICIMGVTRLLKLQADSAPKPYKETVITDAADIAKRLAAVYAPGGTEVAKLDDAAWRVAGIMDDNSEGWTGRTLKVKTYPKALEGKAATYLDAATVERAEAFLRKEIKAVVSALERNHPKLSKDQDTAAGAKGAGDIIAAHVSHDPRMELPLERLSSAPQGMDKIHVLFIEGLMRAFPILGQDGTLVDQFKALASQIHEEEQQCTASELMSGLLRGADDWPLESQSTLHAAVAPIINEALAACQPDCVKHWTDGFDMSLVNRDPRRYSSWLATPLAHKAFPDRDAIATADDASISTVTTQIKFSQPGLLQGGWRVAGMGAWFLTQIRERHWVAHPYKQVRERVAEILLLVVRNSASSHAARTTPDAALASFLAWVGEQIGSFVYIKEKLGGAANDSEAGPSAKEKQEQHFIETIATWCIVCTNYDITYGEPVFIALLPHLIKACHHTNPDCATLAKYAVKSLSWLPGLSPTAVQSVLTSTSDLAAVTTSWDVKATVYAFLKVFIPRYSLVLTDKQTKAALALCETGLADGRVDVHLAAKATVVSVIC